MTGDELVAGGAYELYLKGRFYWNQLTEESLDESIQCFNQALEIDPKYALAHAGPLQLRMRHSAAIIVPPEAMLPVAEVRAQRRWNSRSTACRSALREGRHQSNLPRWRL